MDEELSFKIKFEPVPQGDINRLSVPWLKVETQQDLLSDCLSQLSGLSPNGSEIPSINQGEESIIENCNDSDFEYYEDSDASSLGDVFGGQIVEDDD